MRLERRLRLQSEESLDGSITLNDLVQEWWGSRPRLAATTKLNYKDNLDNHILPLLGARKVVELRPRLVGAFLRDLTGRKGLAPATVRKVRTVLSAVMSYAAAMEYVESNPVMKVAPPELPPSDRVAPTIEETALLLLAAEECDEDFLAFLWLAAEGGGRRGETLALRWKDVDFDRGTITIVRTLSAGEDGVHIRHTTKTGRGRTIAISKVSLGHVRSLRERVEARMAEAAGALVSVDPDGLVFSGGQGSRRNLLDGKPWQPTSTSRRFAQLKAKAGVRAEIDLHGLRHTMITELLAAGVDPRTVMGRAGHSSEATTMTVYAKVRPVVDAAAAELWGQLLNEKLDALRRVGTD
jgi:integrase